MATCLNQTVLIVTGENGDSAVMAIKSTWNEMFGGSSSTDSTALHRAPATTTGKSEADRADSWLESTPGFTSNHHSDHTASDLFDSSTMFDDEFLDGLVGVRGGTAGQTDDVWNSSAAGRDTWPSSAADASYSRSPFDDVAAFPEPTAASTATTGGEERARPRPRPQAAGATGINIDNPFSVTLQAATAAARSAIEALVLTTAPSFHISGAGNRRRRRNLFGSNNDSNNSTLEQ